MRRVLLLVALLGCSSAQERFDAWYPVPQRVKVPEAATPELSQYLRDSLTRARNRCNIATIFPTACTEFRTNGRNHVSSNLASALCFFAPSIQGYF